MASRHVEPFLSRIRNVERTRKRMEELFDDRQLCLRDVEAVYEGLLLRSVVAFEDLLEAVFFECLNAGAGNNQRGARIEALTPAIMREVVMAGDSYLTWLPYKATEKRARLFLRGGRPFVVLDDADKSRLAHIVIIRNAVAHASKHARQEFRDKVIGNTNLLPREKTPAGFLRSHTQPNLTRLQVYVGELGRIAQKLN